MSTRISKPFPEFTDIDGQPLEDGYLYIGTAGLDPSTNAIAVYSDSSLSTSVTQPVRTTGGVPYVSGSPVQLFTAATDYSLRVSNKNNTQVFQDLNAGSNQLNLGPIVVEPDGDVNIDEDTLFIDASTDRVGIGTSSPSRKFNVESSQETIGSFYSSSVSRGVFSFLDANTTSDLHVRLGASGDNMVFVMNTDEAMRIDASGNVGIGTSSPSRLFHLASSGDTNLHITSGTSGETATDGFTIVNQNTTNNVIFNQRENADLLIYTNNTEAMRIEASGNTIAGADNTLTLGSASRRWSEVFAGNGTINTSDEREKYQVEIDQRVLNAVNSINVKSFKWNDSIDKKGDGARIHYGVIAQEVKSAFEAQGLVAEEYGVLCYDEWDDEFEEKIIEPAIIEKREVLEGVFEDVVLTPAVTESIKVKSAGNRYGVRYDELYAMKIAALTSRIEALENA